MLSQAPCLILGDKSDSRELTLVIYPLSLSVKQLFQGDVPLEYMPYDVNILYDI